MYENGMEFSPCLCNYELFLNNPYGIFMWQKTDNVRVRKDNTKHQFMPLPNYYSVTCIKILQWIGLTEKLHIDADGNVLEFKSSIPFSHSYRHVPPTKATNDINISPVGGYSFAVWKSFHNVRSK